MAVFTKSAKPKPEDGKASAKKAGSRKKKSQTREYTEAILVALLAALLIRTFIIQAFRIPTGSMKDTLLVGDFLLVNKFIYGARTPDSIPFTDILLPYLRLPAFKDPEPGEIVVFKFPDNLTQDYIKRCIAAPGQTIELRDGDVFIDGKPEGRKELVQKRYDANEGHFIEYYKITRDGGQAYTIRHYADKNRQLDDYPPLRVPRKGETVDLTLDNLRLYQKVISQYEGHLIRVNDGKIYIDGRPASQYTFAQDYFFMMGDNRDNSSDSRVWGVLPRENVEGEALVIYWSWDWDWDKPLYKIFQAIRWSRIGSLIR